MKPSEKKLRCRDLGFDCDHEIVAGSEAEILTQTFEHAQLVHGLPEVTPELIELVRTHTQET